MDSVRNWTAIGSEMLITGGVSMNGDTTEFELRLFDTIKENLLVGKRYRSSTSDYDQIARRFCSEVLYAVTGSRGFFDSRIAFVSNGAGQRRSTCAISMVATLSNSPITKAFPFFRTGRRTVAGSPTPPMRTGIPGFVSKM
jgi:hypothetical protein